MQERSAIFALFDKRCSLSLSQRRDAGMKSQPKSIEAN